MAPARHSETDVGVEAGWETKPDGLDSLQTAGSLAAATDRDLKTQPGPGPAPPLSSALAVGAGLVVAVGHQDHAPLNSGLAVHLQIVYTGST